MFANKSKSKKVKQVVELKIINKLMLLLLLDFRIENFVNKLYYINYNYQRLNYIVDVVFYIYNRNK